MTSSKQRWRKKNPEAAAAMRKNWALYNREHCNAQSRALNLRRGIDMKENLTHLEELEDPESLGIEFIAEMLVKIRLDKYD